MVYYDRRLIHIKYLEVFMKKKIIALLLAALCAGVAFAQEDGATAGETTIIETKDNASNDPYSFSVTSEKKGRATVDLSFNELTGVLRVTYSIPRARMDEADATIAIRDSVMSFARSHGYLKARVYQGDDAVSYSPDGKTAYMRRFYILYDKSGVD